MNTFNKELLWRGTFPLLKLQGKGCKQFLNGQTTSEISSFGRNSIFKTCWLSPTGRLKALLEVCLHENGAEIVVLLGSAIELSKGFEKVIFPSDNVKIQSLEEIKRVQVVSFLESWKKSKFEWILPGNNLPEIFHSYDIANDLELKEWKIRQGLCFDSELLKKEVLPYELGFSDLISLEKGCYLGQETMAKIKNAGQLRQQLRVWSSTKEDSTKQGETKSNRNIIVDSMELKNGFFIGLSLIRRDFLLDKEVYISSEYKPARIFIPIGFS